MENTLLQSIGTNSIQMWNLKFGLPHKPAQKTSVTLTSIGSILSGDLLINVDDVKFVLISIKSKYSVNTLETIRQTIN